MTMSSSILSTIQEDGDKVEMVDERNVRNMLRIDTTEASAKNGELDLSEQIERNVDFGVKQMRVPNKISAANNKDLAVNEASTKRIPLNENELEAAGDSFLDALG